MVLNIKRGHSLLLAAVIAAVSFGALYIWTARPIEATTAFVTTWKTDQISPNDRTITIPTVFSSNYNYFIDWGDGTTDSAVQGSISHTYNQPGTYTVSISGTFPRISFFGSDDRNKILSVDSWGAIEWESMVDAFVDCDNLQINATDAPNLSNVDSLSGMFREASNMNSPIGHWNVSNVKSIAYMFEGASSFNQNLSAWNTSNIRMFASAFHKATSFNQNINSWDMSKALSTNSMFADAESFNQPVNQWNLGTVLDMRGMFNNAFSFNQDVSAWNISAARRIESLFRNAINFQQDVSTWDFSSVQFANNLFSGTRLSGTNYDKLLVTLSQTDLQDGVVFDAGASTYCFAEAERAIVQNNKNWLVLDQGQDTTSCGTFDIQFDSGVAAAIDENQPVDSLVGSFVTTGSSLSSPFSYSFCSTLTVDSSLFVIRDGQLYTQASFDYEKPQDENQDNVYNLCVVSQNNGFTLQRLLTVAVIDIDDPVADPADSSNSVGEVLGGTSDVNGTTDSTDESPGGQVLAASGVAILTGLLVGTALVFTPLFSRWRAFAPRETEGLRPRRFQFETKLTDHDPTQK